MTYKEAKQKIDENSHLLYESSNSEQPHLVKGYRNSCI